MPEVPGGGCPERGIGWPMALRPPIPPRGWPGPREAMPMPAAPVGGPPVRVWRAFMGSAETRGTESQKGAHQAEQGSPTRGLHPSQASSGRAPRCWELHPPSSRCACPWASVLMLREVTPPLPAAQWGWLKPGGQECPGLDTPPTEGAHSWEFKDLTLESPLGFAQQTEIWPEKKKRNKCVSTLGLGG